jgi:hypothetical protein
MCSGVCDRKKNNPRREVIKKRQRNKIREQALRE